MSCDAYSIGIQSTVPRRRSDAQPPGPAATPSNFTGSPSLPVSDSPRSIKFGTALNVVQLDDPKVRIAAGRGYRQQVPHRIGPGDGRPAQLQNNGSCQQDLRSRSLQTNDGRNCGRATATIPVTINGSATRTVVRSFRSECPMRVPNCRSDHDDQESSRKSQDFFAAPKR